VAQPVELAKHFFCIVDEWALGDLKLQSLGWKPSLAQDMGDGLSHIGAAKLGAGTRVNLADAPKV
jgi:hypothetical protein